MYTNRSLISVVLFSFLASNLLAQGGSNTTSIEAFYGSDNLLKNSKDYNDWIFGEVYQFDPGGYLDRGVDKYNSGLYEEAMKDLNQSIDLAPDCGPCFYMRGLNNRALDEIESAKADLQVAIRLDSTLVEAYNDLGLLYYFEEGNQKKAKELLQKAIEYGPDKSLSYHNLGIFHLISGHPNWAIKQFEEAIIRDSCSVSSYLGMSVSYMEKQNLKQATLCLDQVLGCENSSSDFFYAKAALESLRGKWEESLDDITQAILLEEENSDYYSFRADVHIRKRNYRKATEDLVTANNIYLAKSKEKQSRPGRINEYTAIVHYFGEHKNAIEAAILPLLEKGLCKLITGELYDAKAIFNKAIHKSKGENSLTYYLAAITAEELRDFESAHTYYDQTLQLDDTVLVAYEKRALFRKDNQDYEGAIQDFTKVLALDPNYHIALKERAITNLEIGKINLAVVDFSKYLQYDSLDYDVLFNRGVCYEALKFYDNAINDFNIILEMRKRDVESLYHRGVCYYYNNEPDLALMDCDSMLRYYKDYALGHNLKGVILLETAEYTDAIYNFNQAILNSNNYSEAYVNRYNALMKLERYLEALEDLNKVIELNPNTGLYYYLRAQLKKQLGLENACPDLNLSIQFGLELSQAEVDEICE